ncbi:MAG: imidazole glycerol phosphate synthase subunit HisH [Deltaproteobacteria bacterium]|nr:imidazole glycerol phosphate synthase subunit HisH [Deltaproteobacteria bacterium]
MIAIIDYKAGNLTSVQRALWFLGMECVVTHDYSRIMSAERIVFPGVGAAGSAMADLRAMDLDKAIIEAFHVGKPILGICLGTQVIMEASEENDTKCLGVIKGQTKRFPEVFTDHNGHRLKVPHMGWNRVSFKRRHPLLDGIGPENEFYFVHSYYPEPSDPAKVLGQTDYGIVFPSVLVSGNLVATQFHPEKSGQPGLRILANFCKWSGKDHVE